jgi:hypothetical protein
MAMVIEGWPCPATSIFIFVFESDESDGFYERTIFIDTAQSASVMKKKKK